jgi:hypothetical protein
MSPSPCESFGANGSRVTDSLSRVLAAIIRRINCHCESESELVEQCSGPLVADIGGVQAETDEARGEGGIVVGKGMIRVSNGCRESR